MLKTLFSSPVEKTISLYLGMNKIALCKYEEGKPKLVAGEYIQSDREWATVLNKVLLANELKNHRVSVVISKDFYQTFDIDKPLVEEKELLGALPFTIKDLVSSSVFDLVVDYVDRPAQTRKNTQIMVVCIEQSRVVQIRDLLSQNGLTLNSMTIEEIATCQLFDCLNKKHHDKNKQKALKNNDANILIAQHEGELLLSVVKNGQLYFSSHLRGFRERLAMPLQDEENTLIEDLSLEIQRVLDFINSQLKVSAINTLYLAINCADLDLLSAKLSEYIAQNVKPFSTLCDDSFVDSNAHNYDFLLAYGGLSKGLVK